MTLAIALLIEGATPLEARQISVHLRSAVPDNIPLLLIDAGTEDATSCTLASLAATSHAEHVALSRTDCSPNLARSITRRMTGARHVLLVRAHERLVFAALPQLADWLVELDPERALLAGGWWLNEPYPPRPDALPQGVLPYPDAARLAALPQKPDAAALRSLCPDPRRILVTEDAPDESDPFSDPALAWESWQKLLSGPATPTVFPEPVLLRPLPEAGAAATLALALTRLKDTPRGERGRFLEETASWLGDALVVSSAAEAPETDAALHRIWSMLSRRLRAQAAALPGPAGVVFSAVARGQSLAALSLLATARQEQIVRVMLAEQSQLRANLDLALPGPDYLADLYARVRDL